MIGYILDDIFVEHRAPAGHPERPARAEAVRDALLAAGVASTATHVAARLARDHELAAVHAGSYLSELERVVPGRTGWLDPDTYFSPKTWDAARTAAGATAELALRVMSGELRTGLAVVRPPGHHATRDRAMGFCLINNVAVAAAAARAAGAARVAIVDWDVHHGNGTQDIFWDDPSVLYASSHQYPYYPGTGAPSELGGPNAKGGTINVGLPSGSHDADFAAAFDHVFVPALRAFKPDLVLVSAGFDAFERDPIAGMRMTHAGFAALARRLRLVADEVAGGRIAFVLEGGYDLDGVAGGMTAVLRELTTASPTPMPIAPLPPEPSLVRAAIEGTRAAHAAAGVPLPDAEQEPR